jgi:hypothetical protein
LNETLYNCRLEGKERKGEKLRSMGGEKEREIERLGC